MKFFHGIIHFFINMKLKKKLFLSYLFAALIPMLTITSYTYFQTKNNLTQQSFLNMSNNLEQVNNNIEENLKSYYYIAEIITINRYVQDYITLDYSNYGYEDMYYFIDNFFKGIMLTNPFIRGITVFSENSTLPMDEYYFKPIDESVKKTEWYANLENAKGKTIYGELQQNTRDEWEFSIVKSMNRYNVMAPSGILSISIDERQIDLLIEKAAGKNELIVLDKEDNIIFCNNKEIIGKNISEVISTTTFTDFEHSTTEYNGKPMLMTSLSVKNGWRTISLVDEDLFWKEARRASTHVISIFLASLILIVILVYLISTAMCKRLHSLMDGVKQMEQGDFDLSLPPMGNDEVGELRDGFVSMSQKVNHLIHEGYEKELMKKRSELNLIQEQINPHFLYNTLSSISSLALRNMDMGTHQMVKLLSDFYRLSLNKGKDVLSIRDEIKLTNCYIEIQKVRFRDMIEVNFDVDEDILDCKTIKLILQPFIENSINHGILLETSKLHIAVKIYRIEHNICFEVSDDGAGMDKDTLDALREDILSATEGFGLKNVNVRIKLRYGEGYGVLIQSEQGVGTKISILIPASQPPYKI